MNKVLLDKLLSFYKINEDQYRELTKNVSIDNFLDGHNFEGIENTALSVKNEISKQGKIIIYGDYDADGIMGVSILKKAFDYLGYNVDYYVPSRYLDGYGINIEHAKEYVEKHYSMVITVDNGITAFEPIEYLHNNGVKVIVIDHHTPSEKLPTCDHIVHPGVSKLGDATTSGAFCAFIFTKALLGYFDKYLSILASISLISDIMPLISYNRNLLRVVFKEYITDEFLPISLLADNGKLNETTIGMKVAPRINAIGRMVEDTSINDVIKYFTSNNNDDIITYFNKILLINEERKSLSKSACENVVIDNKNSAIIEVLDIKEGIIGLVANSLVTKYHRPTIIFTKDSSGECYKGSARSVDGFNIVDAFNSLSNYLETYGGHALAGGCSIKIEYFEQFKEKFILLTNESHIEPKEKETINIKLIDVNRDNFNLIQTFSPFGEGMPSPIFKIDRIKTNTLFYDRTFTHILTTIGNGVKIVGFNLPRNTVGQYQFINLIGNIDINEYKGIITTQFSIKEISESKI